MTRSYRILALALVLLAAWLVVAVRAPRRPATPPERASGAPRAATIDLVVGGGAVRPERTAVPKGANVSVTAVNQDRVARTISLLGYEDRIATTRIGPGDTIRLRFAADRPGEDFAWLVDGRPAGTLAVTGSHLVEGHR
ncbi:MAG TPA: cupredoxin domain-containing protein [Candidatus Eisenbacteria bacterium]